MLNHNKAPVPRTGLLIGSQGANIKELRRDSGCKARFSLQPEAYPGEPWFGYIYIYTYIIITVNIIVIIIINVQYF